MRKDIRARWSDIPKGLFGRCWVKKCGEATPKQVDWMGSGVGLTVGERADGPKQAGPPDQQTGTAATSTVD